MKPNDPAIPNASALTGTEYSIYVQSGLDVRVTLNQILTLLGPSTLKTSQKYRRPGKYSVQAASSGVGQAYTAASGSLRAFPFLVTDALTFTTIKTRVSTLQAGGKYRIGIYTAKTDGTIYPDTLVSGTDIQEYDASATGTQESTTVNITLQPGLYWVANLANAAIGLDGYTSHSLIALDVDDVLSNGFTNNRFLVAQTYGAMPTTFPAGATFGGGSNYPVVGFKNA